MDKALPDSEMRKKVKPHRVMINLTQGQPLPGMKPFYRGTIPFRRTLSLDDIAESIFKQRTEYRKETLVTTYRLMNDAIYEAFEQGFNVDFGLGRTELTVKGQFSAPADPFDRKRHSLQVHLRPSPRFLQIADSLPAETRYTDVHKLFINEVSTVQESYRYQPEPKLPFNQLPAGSRFFYLHGGNIRLLGEDERVGITLRNLESGEEWFFPLSPSYFPVNEASAVTLLLPEDFPLTAGEWELQLATQFNPSFRHYKIPRTVVHSFTVYG